MAGHGHVEVRGGRLCYASTGTGSSVLLHGGLTAHHTVIVMGSRGRCRSTRDTRHFSVDLLADDVIALLDISKIDQVDVVGWSDCANIGLGLAMRHPARIRKLFALDANASVAGMSGDPEKNSIFSQVMVRMGADDARLLLTSKAFDSLVEQMSTMSASELNWSDAQPRTIKWPVWTVDGDHEEFIRCEHTARIAATIPGASLLILPKVSHFAPLQAPSLFNAAVLQFLDGRSTAN